MNSKIEYQCLHKIIDLEERVARLEQSKREPTTLITVTDGLNSYWFICEKCNGRVDATDHYCKHCGREIYCDN